MRNFILSPWGVVVFLVLILIAGGAWGVVKNNNAVVLPTTVPTATSTPSGQDVAAYDSGIRGKITQGPTCPVMREGSTCADLALQVPLAIYHANDLSHVFAQTSSDEMGQFEISLPPGDYIVTAATKVLYPRCGQTPITVEPSVYETTTIMCDTGIR